MTPLVMTIVVVPVVLIVGAYVVGRMVGHIPAKIGVMVWLATGTLVVVSVLVGVILYFQQEREHQVCTELAEGRNVLDDGFGKLAAGLDRLRDAMGPTLEDLSQPTTAAFQQLVDDMEQVSTDLVPLDPDECLRPLTLGG